MTGGGVPDDVTPLLGHTGRGTASELRTAGNIFISIVGAGVLGLPYVFKTSGWAVAVATVTLAASLTYYCMLLLVSSPFSPPISLSMNPYHELK
jgi:proton-coupled amino acid transporter